MDLKGLLKLANLFYKMASRRGAILRIVGSEFNPKQILVIGITPDGRSETEFKFDYIRTDPKTGIEYVNPDVDFKTPFSYIISEKSASKINDKTFKNLSENLRKYSLAQIYKRLLGFHWVNKIEIGERGSWINKGRDQFEAELNLIIYGKEDVSYKETPQVSSEKLEKDIDEEVKKSENIPSDNLPVIPDLKLEEQEQDIINKLNSADDSDVCIYGKYYHLFKDLLINKNLKKRILPYLVYAKSSHVRQVVADEVNIQYLLQMRNDPNDFIREVVAKRIDPNDLPKMIKDSFWAVRYIIARRIDPIHLPQLANDPNPNVARRAQKRLTKLRQLGQTP